MKKSLLLLFLFPLCLFAQKKQPAAFGIDQSGGLPKGLKVGDQAPRIQATDIHGKSIDSHEILKTARMVLVFYRGEWCPYCNRHLGNLADSASYIREKNAQLIAVGPESQEHALEIADESEATFPVIADTSERILKNYDVLFRVTKKYERKIKHRLFTSIAKNNEQDEARLPVPAAYIIEKDGTISYRYFDYNYKTRVAVSELLKQLD